MLVSTVRNILVLTFVLLLPNFVFGDHDNVLEEIDSHLSIIIVTTVLAIISFLLLVISRNKYLGCINLISGIALIVVGTEKTDRYLLTENPANIYILTGFVQIAFSVIFGWIYQKNSLSSQATIYLTDEMQAAKSNKRAMTLSAVFFVFLIQAIYNYIWFYNQAEIGFFETQFHMTNIGTLIFVSLATYLFIKNTQTGWILGTAFIISLTLPLITNQISTIIVVLKYHVNISIVPPTYNAILFVCLAICLFFILSGSVTNKFNIKKKQIIIALVAGLAFSFLKIYLSIRATEMSFKSEYYQKINADSAAQASPDYDGNY